MATTVRAAPSHAIIFVGDPTGEIPETTDGDLVASTATCVAVGTQYAHDGETSVTLAENVDAVETTGKALAFDGVLHVPSGRISVCTVEQEVLLEMSVPGSRVHLQIWVNHPSVPDVLLIAVKPAVAEHVQ